jgi:hypothetical protein
LVFYHRWFMASFLNSYPFSLHSPQACVVSA